MLRLIKHTYNKLIKLTLLWSVSLFSNMLFSQVLRFESIDETCHDLFPEKVFVHFSQNSVIAGDDLEFSTYIISNQGNSKNHVSSIVYFDVLNWDNQLVYNWRSNVKNGLASGSVTIPDSLSTGIYQARAYTRWMLNNGSGFFYQIPIYVQNLKDEDLKYLSAAKYKSKSGINGSQKSSLVDLRAQLTGNHLKVGLNSSKNSLTSRDLKLLGFIHGKKVLEEHFNSGSNSEALWIESVLDKELVGLLQLVVINDWKEVLATKNIHLIGSTEPLIEIEGERGTYPTSEQVNLVLSSANLDKDEQLFFSCSVHEKGTILPDFGAAHMDNYLEYYSDINASKWFNSQAGYMTGDQSMDNNIEIGNWLWSNYYFSEPNCNFSKENHSFLLEGDIKSINGEPLTNAKIFLSHIADQAVAEYAISNEKGEFYFWLNQDFDNKNLILQVMDGHANNQINWMLKRHFSLEDNMLENRMLKLTESQTAKLNEIADVELINQIYKEKEEQLEKPATEKGLLKFVPDYVVYPDDYIDLKTFEEVANNILPGVFFKKRKDQWTLSFFNNLYRDNLIKGGTIFLNGVPFTDWEYIAAIPKETIDHIDVFASNYFFGKINFKGIVAIYTKKRELPNSYTHKGMKTLYNEVIDYNTNQIVHKVKEKKNHPDFKRQLFWSPTQVLSSEKELNLSFYTSKLKTTYILDIQGITNKGKPVSLQYEFRVE